MKKMILQNGAVNNKDEKLNWFMLHRIEPDTFCQRYLQINLDILVHCFGFITIMALVIILYILVRWIWAWEALTQIVSFKKEYSRAKCPSLTRRRDTPNQAYSCTRRRANRACAPNQHLASQWQLLLETFKPMHTARDLSIPFNAHASLVVCFIKRIHSPVDLFSLVFVC